MFGDFLKLAQRAVRALERIADALERADPEWRRQDETTSKTEVLTRGR